MKLEKEVYINDYEFDCFDDGLKYDIVEFYRENYFTNEERKFIIKNCGKKLKLTLEVEEPILDEEERKYLSDVIRPFRDRVIYIKKQEIFSNTSFIEICVGRFSGDCSENIELPEFCNEKMYKGMELNKEYTLEELGL